MPNMSITKYLLLAFFFNMISLLAQDVPVNYIGWYSYNGYHAVNKANTMALLVEGTIQRNNIVVQPIQWAYRLGMSYQLKNGDRIAGGYAFQYNYPYDDASPPYNAINRRIWEQYTIRIPFSFNTNDFVSHRFRLEQIWTQQKAAPDYNTTSAWAFSNILRYQFLINIPLDNTWSLNFNDEVFLNMYKFNTLKLLNQNRIYAGMIYNIDKANIWKINAGYMFQSVWNSKETETGRKRMNNVLRVSVIADLPLYKKKN